MILNNSQTISNMYLNSVFDKSFYTGVTPMDAFRKAFYEISEGFTILFSKINRI